jgi:hypothetical protein
VFTVGGVWPETFCSRIRKSKEKKSENLYLLLELQCDVIHQILVLLIDMDTATKPFYSF